MPRRQTCWTLATEVVSRGGMEIRLSSPLENLREVLERRQVQRDAARFGWGLAVESLEERVTEAADQHA